MVMMCVSFRYGFTLNINLFFAVLNVDLEEIVEPSIGFYLFMLATITSLIFTHIMVHYHRKVEELKITFEND